MQAEKLRREVAEVIAPMGLRLSLEKTRVVSVDIGFDFLGFHIRRMRKRGTDRSYIYTVPSHKAVQAIRDTVKTRTSKSTLNSDLGQLLMSLNRSLQGWANYFRYAVAKRLFGQLDTHAWRRIGIWIRNKHGRMSWREVRRRFCVNGWHYTHNGVTLSGASSVAATRYRYRGYRIPTPWTEISTAEPSR